MTATSDTRLAAIDLCAYGGLACYLLFVLFLDHQGAWASRPWYYHTIAGVGAYLKEQNADVKIGLADPMGAAIYNYYVNGELKAEGSSITEGIGQGRITANLEGAVVDMPYQITDEEMLPVLYELIVKEGLSLGTSSGINVAGAIRMARDLGPGHTIVTVLCDGAHRYASKIFNMEFLIEKGLPLPSWLAK